MLPYFGHPSLALVASYIESLSLSDRKALITLARSQLFPISTDHTLLSKTSSVLDQLVVEPPYTDYRHETFTEVGSILFDLVTTPYLTGVVITLCLGASVQPEVVQLEYGRSFDKEFCATQTRRDAPAWNWQLLLSGDQRSDEIVHPLFPKISPLQRSFSVNLRRFRNRLSSGRVLKPHYTRRGISGETSGWLNHRISSFRDRCFGSSRTFHNRINRRNITSRDVVHHYIRTGVWPPGRVEMRQQWKPSILTPRTYFAWGGDAIRSSTYLRNFFNDLADQFEPSHRHNRVRPTWLRCSETIGRPSFLFYDLTSFTSWFHEHEPFLRALQEYFRGVTVFLVSADLRLTEADVGSLIEQYADNVNSFPEYYISSAITGVDESLTSYYHLCSGFLGVPGNLVTCTLAHGLAQAEGYSTPTQLQVPGDDVGAETRNDERRLDKLACATSLGSLQYDKVYHSDQAAVYLKRGVRLELDGVNLADMLVWPLFPYLQHENLRSSDYLDTRVRLPPPRERTPRACRIMVTFMRNLWVMTKGQLPALHKAFILEFLTTLHDHMGIPREGVLQGRYISDSTLEEQHLEDVPLKFPVDRRYMESDPDELFASEFVEVFIARDVTEEEVKTEFLHPLEVGDTMLVYRKQGWSFLEDMGYVELIQRYGGEKVLFVGEEAKRAYLTHMAPRVSQYRVISPLSISQLISVGILPGEEGAEFTGVDISDTRHMYVDLEPLRSFTLSFPKYVDPDKPDYTFDDPLDYGPDPDELLWRRQAIFGDHESETPSSSI
jgi:hypothetical protein